MHDNLRYKDWNLRKESITTEYIHLLQNASSTMTPGNILITAGMAKKNRIRRNPLSFINPTTIVL